LAPRLAKAVPECDLLVVDDGSPDGTADLAETLFKTDEHYATYSVLRRTGPRGLGVAYRDGFSWALKAGYDMIIQMDADLSHDPADLPAMLKAAEQADLVIGSRYCKGGRMSGWAASRAFLSRFAGWYVRCILGLPFADPTAGFRCWTRRGLERVNIASLNSEGYAFQVEMALRAVQAKLSVEEVPITFHDRTQGKSKMSRAVLFESMVLPWKLRFSRSFRETS
jgi:dolichol-phosphate mannosyltransferase